MSCLTCNIPVYNLEGDGRLRNADGQLHICDSAGTETDAVDPVVEQAAEELGRIAGEAVSKARVQIKKGTQCPNQ